MCAQITVEASLRANEVYTLIATAARTAEETQPVSCKLSVYCRSEFQLSPAPAEAGIIVS